MNLDELKGAREKVEREMRFSGLPDGLKDQFYRSPVVHMWVTAFLFGRIGREEMLAELASALAVRNSETEKQLMRFTEWFGCPPVVIIPNG